MIRPEQIKWGSYRQYEGPYFWGTHKYKIPTTPDDADRVAYVIATTEGGTYDAVNMYDKMILSVGLFQYAEMHQALVTRMLWNTAKANFDLMEPFEHLMPDAYEFSPDGFSKFYDDCRCNPVHQRSVFLGGASGLKGQWNPEQRYTAKSWAAACVNFLRQPGVKDRETEIARHRAMTWFMTNYARKILIDRKPLSNEPMHRAVFAIYQSYAANNPSIAATQLKRTMTECSSTPWSEKWCLKFIHNLVFGSGITIYPDRYNKIRPVVEHLYQVDLPDLARDIARHSAQFGRDVTTVQVQSILIYLGYDLGQAGSDGVFGPKTSEALLAFQKDQGLEQTAYVDADTVTALLEEQKLQQQEEKAKDVFIKEQEKSPLWGLLDKFNPRMSLRKLMGNDD